MKLWGGRFSGKMDAKAWEFNASIGFDKRLGPQDVRGSMAWARALNRAGLLLDDETSRLVEGLREVEHEFKRGEFKFQPDDEDIHTAVERRLGELVGSLSGKLHTGRSRNDQVATDLRLWLLDHLPYLQASMLELQGALVGRAESDLQTIMPGYTHMQPAQPILLAHWWLSHFWPLQRDLERLAQLANRTASLPLGASALAGTPFPIDRNSLAEELGFIRPCQNSLDAVSDRDFAAEFLFCTALAGTHLSHLAEQIVLFSNPQFGFFELPDEYTTGSSLMPQKKNPDTPELIRAKSGILLGNLVGLMTVLKALPSAYDKDLQEDKQPVFSSYDTLTRALVVMAGLIRGIKLFPSKMSTSLNASMAATDLADFLVTQGIPFREAHEQVGRLVRLALEKEVSLDQLPLETYQSVNPRFDMRVFDLFNPMKSISRRSPIGGSAPEAVAEQLNQARSVLDQALQS